MRFAPPDVPTNDIVQIIVLVLIVLGSALTTLLRRLDRWIQTHRFPQGVPRPGEEPQRPGEPAPPQARAPQPGQRSAEEAEDAETVLMRELERALLGVERPRPAQRPAASPEGEAPLSRTQAAERAEAPAASRGPQRGAPLPEPGAVPSFGQAPVGMEELPRAVFADDRPHPAMAARVPTAAPMPARAAAPRAVASVARRRYGHLAVLRSPEDLRKAIVLAEILGPPVCHRPVGWRFLR